MDNEAKNTLKERKVIFPDDCDTYKPLFNYSSFIRYFDCNKEYNRILEYLWSAESKFNKAELLYKELFKLISFHSSSIIFSIMFTEKTCFFTSQEVLIRTNQILRHCKNIKELEFYFHDSNCYEKTNYDFGALINSFTEIYSLKLKIISPEIEFSILQTDVFRAIKNKAHLIKEIEIDFFKNIPIEIISECINLKVLRINLKNRSNFDCLNSLIVLLNLNRSEKLMKCHLIILKDGIIDFTETIEKTANKVETKCIKCSIKDINCLTNYFELFQQILGKERKEFLYIEIILTKSKDEFAFGLCI